MERKGKGEKDTGWGRGYNSKVKKVGDEEELSGEGCCLSHGGRKLPPTEKSLRVRGCSRRGLVKTTTERGYKSRKERFGRVEIKEIVKCNNEKKKQKISEEQKNYEM